MSKFNPGQLAFDRIQQAAMVSPVIIGEVTCSYSLRPEGILVEGRSTSGFYTSELVPWLDLMRAQASPIPEVSGIVIREINEAILKGGVL